MIGLIIKALSGFYYVKCGDEVIECKARGRFRSAGETPLVGDWVDITVSESIGVVDKILPRKNFLERPPIANIDKLFIVSSSVVPAPNTLLIDRLCALCEYKNIIPVILFNKSDIETVEKYVGKYKRINYKSIECSAKNGLGTDEIIEELKGSVSAFTGNSGVGKSSLLNVIFPTLKLSIGNVSEKLGRGKHTTRHTELFEHEYGGYVADTPGFSSLENDIFDLRFKEALADCFREFADYEDGCRFSDCKHIGEKGCAVCKAVDNGLIDSDRYNSYLTIYNELKDIKPWEVKKSDGR